MDVPADQVEYIQQLNCQQYHALETARLKALKHYQFKLLEFGVFFAVIIGLLLVLCVYMGFKSSITRMGVALSCQWILVSIIEWREGEKSPIEKGCDFANNMYEDDESFAQ